MRPVLLAFACLVAAAFAAPALAQSAPVTWCGGTDEVPGDRVPDLDVASRDQVRFVYVVPQGEPDHFPDDASGIATDAAWIGQWWQAQDPSRAPARRRSARTTSASGA